MGSSQYYRGFIAPRIRETAEKKKRISKGLFSSIREKRFVFITMLIFGSFFTGFLQAMQEIMLPLFATSIGFDISQVGLIIGAASLITIASLLIIGKRIDEKSPFLMLFVFYLLMLTFPLLVQIFSDWAGLVIAGGIFLTGRAANLNISRSFFSELSQKHKATAIGIGETVYYFSRSFGSAVTGIFAEFFGYTGTFSFMALFSFVALGGAAVLIAGERRGVSKK